jgi:hypothetical protein
MDAIASARLRRQLPIVAALLVCAGFLAVHVSVFEPLQKRYHRLLAQAAELGLLVDPSHPATQLPLTPRLFTLLSSNSVPAGSGDARGQSGAWTAEVVQTLTAAAARRGLETVVAEPGLVTQQENSVEVRAHVRLRGRYASLVAMVDDLARSDRLWNVERFSVRPLGQGLEDIELWMSACMLKHSGSQP